MTEKHAAGKKKVPKPLLISIIVFSVIAILFGSVYGFYHSKISLIDFNDGKTSGDYVDPDDSELNVGADEMESATAGLEDKESISAEGDLFYSEDIINILLIGTDERTSNFSANARGDTCMLLSLNKKKHTVKLVSFERGMGVPILSGAYEGQYDWLTHTFRYGGADLMMREIQECFRIKIDRYIRVNMKTFIDGINVIGGITVTLSQAEADYINKTDTQNVSAGVNHLNAEAALTYARCRSIDSDWIRIQRQRNVISAAMNQIKDLNIFEFNNTLNTVLPLVQTNLTEGEITGLLLLAPKFKGAEIEGMTIPTKGTYGSMTGLGGRNLFSVDFKTNTEILHDFITS